MSFETLVRPFAAPESLGTRRIPVIVAQVPTQDATLTWGQAGNIIEPQETVPATNVDSSGQGVGDSNGAGGNFFGFQVRSCNTKSQEQTRKTTTQRITNPDDPSQFVDVQVPQAITFELRPQKDILESGFDGATTTFAGNDEIYSIIEDIVNPTNRQDVCNQSFAFSNP